MTFFEDILLTTIFYAELGRIPSSQARTSTKKVLGIPEEVVAVQPVPAPGEQKEDQRGIHCLSIFVEKISSLWLLSIDDVT
jgi:hypothetical protein